MMRKVDAALADGFEGRPPAQRMLDWMPKSISSLGAVEDSVLNGPALFIELSHRDATTERLRAAGYSVVDDQSLVAAASGR